MAEDSGAEKTERASGKRREDARGKGQVAKSQEVSGAALLLVGMTLLVGSSGHFARVLGENTRYPPWPGPYPGSTWDSRGPGIAFLQCEGAGIGHGSLVFGSSGGGNRSQCHAVRLRVQPGGHELQAGQAESPDGAQEVLPEAGLFRAGQEHGQDRDHFLARPRR